MSQLTEAANELLAHARHLEAFKTAAQALHRLDSLATAETEAKARRESIEKQAVDAESRLAGVQGILDEATRRSEAGVQGILDDAKDRAAEIVKSAEDEQAALTMEARAIRNAALEAKAAVDADVAAVIVKRDAAARELSDLEAKISKAKAAFRRLLS